ncbi:MAG: RnfABCDGE type electron transport complex subunit D [Spirochaetales bacterium]|jgi:electron transport complex protein RnfD|nr:RnfABCDGE type electron transport complex subunit D [Spirochaetales bacterium]
MSEDINKILRVESSPHLRNQDTTSAIMWSVVIALLPAGIWSVLKFGPYVFAVLAVSIGTAAALEYLFCRYLGKGSLADGSAVLTGLLIAYNMPPGVVLYVPMIASAFAIAVVKWSFGGLGANWVNPALAGRVFVFFSRTGAMTSWKIPAVNYAADTVSGATVLGSVKTGLFDLGGSVTGPIDVLTKQGYNFTETAVQLSGKLSSIGLHISPIHIDLFIGNVSGSLGEISALLLLAGAVYLFYRKILTWQIPLAYILSFSILIWLFGGIPFNGNLFSGDILFHLFSGGLILGAFFMATDMVTSPTTTKGMIIFGIGAGFLTFLFRVFGSLPEGVSLAIILMNIFVPMIERYITPVKFGRLDKRSEA